MKEKLKKVTNSAREYWSNRTKNQKIIAIGSIVFAIILLVSILFFSTRTDFVPLYNNLSIQESSQVKAELEARGVPYELKNGGTTITVPEIQVDGLLVDLAGQGIPKSGNIDYSFFSENTSWGITENEFNIMKLDAMQTELAHLIESVEGINRAEVMINMPKDPIFVSDSVQPASASIVLNVQPGYQFQPNQINALYTLVSKAVPNLPQENISIMNQYAEYYDQNTPIVGNGQDSYTFQQTVKRDVERDIQRRVQHMLGTMVGMENVIVSVTADIDFTKENRVEEIIEPIDPINMEGLPVSIERIHETYSGNNPIAEGNPGDGPEDIVNNPGLDEGQDGDYELVKETINNEFNRIQKEIVESPYKLRDLGIQVAVNRVKEINGNEIEYLSGDEELFVQDGISDILGSIVTTSVDKEYGDVLPEEKISIVFQEFSESAYLPDSSTGGIPTWVYIAGAILMLAVLILVIMLLRRRKEASTDRTNTSATTEIEIPELAEDVESESVIRKKQLERMAKENPEDFAKLLRSWMSEE